MKKLIFVGAAEALVLACGLASRKKRRQKEKSEDPKAAAMKRAGCINQEDYTRKYLNWD